MIAQNDCQICWFHIINHLTCDSDTIDTHLLNVIRSLTDDWECEIYSRTNRTPFSKLPYIYLNPNTVMLGSIKFQLHSLGTYSLKWRVRFLIVSWRLPKTCWRHPGKRGDPALTTAWHRSLQQSVIFWIDISLHRRTPLVVICDTLTAERYVATFFDPFCCRSCCSTLDLLFNNIIFERMA